jgi:hypothetical protein
LIHQLAPFFILPMRGNTLILSTAYLPPVQYFAAIVKHQNFLIEKQENYSKQSYRNRCVIGSANGPLDLVIPVKKAKRVKIPITEVQIDNDYKWQTLHWRAMVSAYKNSPFFEYYEHEFLPFYRNSYENLFDFNLELIEKVLDLTGIEIRLGFTDYFSMNYDENYIDERYIIHPKKQANLRSVAEYTQVFSNKHGFMPNLSIIDLIFNTGPSAKEILYS